MVLLSFNDDLPTMQFFLSWFDWILFAFESYIFRWWWKWKVFHFFLCCCYRFPHFCCWPLVNEYAGNKRWEFITFILNRLPIFILSMIKAMSHVSLYYFIWLFFRVFSFCIADFASLLLLSFRCEHVNAIHLTCKSNGTQFNSMILKLHAIPKINEEGDSAHPLALFLLRSTFYRVYVIPVQFFFCVLAFARLFLVHSLWF